MPKSFGVESTIDGPEGWIHLSGECDLAAVSALQECTARMLADPDVTLVVVDLSEVTFIDSSGIGALVASRNAAGHHGKDCRMTGITGQVERVLTVMGLLTSLTRGTAD